MDARAADARDGSMAAPRDGSAHPDAPLATTHDADAAGARDVGAPAEPCSAVLPRRASEARHVEIDEVVRDQLYLVYSTNRSRTADPSGVVNIWVARLAGRAILVFGSGFGDPMGDHEGYNAASPGEAPARSAAYDAERVRHVAASCLDLDPALAPVDVTFVVPHAHLDHVNQEFLHELDLRGLGPREILVHSRDREQATCGLPCCGRAPLGSPRCDRPDDPDFGAPYDPPWEPDWLARFRTIGSSADVRCTTVVQTFATEGLGTLEVLYNGLHTPGTVDLRIGAPGDVVVVAGGAFTSSVCNGGVGAHDNIVR